MKIGILNEDKMPQDRRVALIPEHCKKLKEQFPEIEIYVQKSNHRCFTENEYLESGIKIVDNMDDCDVLLGVKEVPSVNLIPNKTYFFFSHTTKMQPYNRVLLQEIIKNGIQLVDYELLTDSEDIRIIGFGRFAGLVGAYSGLRAYGLKHKLFSIPAAYTLHNFDSLIKQFKTFTMPPFRIALTGGGRVANGAKEIMDTIGVKEVSPSDYLQITSPKEAVYTQLFPKHYVKSKDSTSYSKSTFYKHPELYENDFLKFTEHTNLLIASAYWDPNAPVLFSNKDMLSNNFKISVISDITCDIKGSIPSTLRPSLIEDPFYDYNPQTEKEEKAFSKDGNITVQAVDNLPNELPRDASTSFSTSMLNDVLPAFIKNSNCDLIVNASIAIQGKLTPKYSYLEDYIAE